MTFQKLLANKEYTVLKRTEEYLYILLSNKRYIFYNKNFELICFSINQFKNITIIDFFQEHYSFNRVEIIALENSELGVDLHFKQKDLSIILGECFRLTKIDKVLPSQVINEEVLKFVQDFDHILPLGKWRFCIEEQLFYLIPNTDFCVQFNSSNYEYFGSASYHLKKGTDEHFCFLNPNTLFDYYRINLPNNKTNIYIGYSEIKDTKQDIIIKGTKQELFDSLIICTNTLSIPFLFSENENVIQLHFVNHEYTNFFQTYFHEIHNQLITDVNYFKAITSLDFNLSNKIAIKSKKVNNLIYPIVEFQNSITHIQLVIEYILNKLLSEVLSIYNLSYTPMTSINSDEIEFIENPEDSFKDL